MMQMPVQPMMQMRPGPPPVIGLTGQKVDGMQMYQPPSDATGYVPPVPITDTELKDSNNLPIYAWYHPVTGEPNYIQHDGQPV